MGTASVTTCGTRYDRLESTSSQFSYRLLQQARTFSSNQEFLLTEKLSSLPIIEITSPTWNPADLRMTGPRSAPTRVVDYISTARWDGILDGDIPSSGFTLHFLPTCERSPRARCTYGDTG
jgi:hypothetical protein